MLDVFSDWALRYSLLIICSWVLHSQGSGLAWHNFLDGWTKVLGTKLVDDSSKISNFSGVTLYKIQMCWLFFHATSEK
jgi:hypothetical protein